MKNKGLLIFLTLGFVVLFFAGCEDSGSSAADPQIRFSNASSSTLYFAMGKNYDSTGNTIDLITGWFTVYSGNISSYTTIEAGNLYFCYDTGSDHSSFSIYTNPYNFQNDKNILSLEAIRPRI